MTLSFEQLEPRRLMSQGAFSPFGEDVSERSMITKTGTLVLKGGETADKISVIRDGNKVRVRIVETDGSQLNMFAKASEFKRVLIEAGGGDDKVFIDNELAKNCTVLGGGGNDTIDGNLGATLLGGSGNDKLSVPAESLVGSSDLVAVLSGGDGNDRLVANATDHVAGGRGNDVALAMLAFDETSGGSDPVTTPDLADRYTGIEQQQFTALVPSVTGAIPRVPDYNVVRGIG